jgi:hypothetical protein
VLIGMDQLPGHNAPPKNLDIPAPADRTVGAAGAQTPRQHLESGLSHFVNIADASINDCADSANRTVKIACHFTPELAEQSRLVEVLHSSRISHIRCTVVTSRRIGPAKLPQMHSSVE